MPAHFAREGSYLRRVAVTRRMLIGASLSSLFLASAGMAAQQPRVARIGYLSVYTPESPEVSRTLETLRQGLRERGYVEGQNIVIEQC